jgi:hypothetical protein
MELTKEEQKVLGEANEGRLKQASERRWRFLVVVIGIILAAGMIVEGVRKLTLGKEGYPQIAWASLFAIFLLAQYESFRFKAVAFSLIWKLKNERDTTQPR